VSTWSDPAGHTFTQQISKAQRVTGISSSASDSTHPGTLLQNVRYAPHGAVASSENGCAGTGCVQAQETYDYNNRLQPVRIQLGTSSSPSASSCIVYNYYVTVSNPSGCTIPSQASSGNNHNVAGHYYADGVNASFDHVVAYTYDPTNRLTSSVATGSATHNLAFAYDRYGNMTCVQNAQTSGLCPQWSFSTATNQLTNSGFNFDAAGNLTSDLSHSYQWDAEGRMTSVDSGSTAAYVYNALGQRVEKNVGGVHTEIVYDGSGEPIGENQGGSWAVTFVNFGGRHLADYQNNATYFPHSSQIGTTGMVTDNTGTVAQDELHYPWGQQWTMAGTQQEERFARFQHRDQETGLDPTHFRMYAGSQGRWLRPDPAGRGSASVANPQSFNRYAYVMNRPGSATDPSGLLMAVPTVWDAAGSSGVSEEFLGPGGHFAPLLSQQGGGGGVAPFSQAKYNSCCQQAFGNTTGKVPGTNDNISFQAATDLVLASQASGESVETIAGTYLIESVGGNLAPSNHLNANGSTIPRTLTARI